MQQTIPANDATISSHVGTTPSTGPFAVDFPFFSLDHVVVTKTPDGSSTATRLIRGADYTLTGVATDDGSFSSGTVTLVLPTAQATITRYRDTVPERLSNFPLQGFFSRLALNAELNKITAWEQENDGNIDAIKALDDRVDHLEDEVDALQDIQTIDIRDFGAVGDGVTDDSGAFNKAAAWLVANRGGTLLLGPFNYRIASTVVFQNCSMWLQGAVAGGSTAAGTTITVDTPGGIVMGSIAGTVLTISSLTVPIVLVSGIKLYLGGVANGTRIVTQLTGTPGGTGTYTITPSQTVAGPVRFNVGFDGMVFANCDYSGIERVCFNGPPDAARLYGGALVNVTGFVGQSGTFDFKLNDVLIQRGFRGFETSASLGILADNLRMIRCSGDAVFFNGPAEDGRATQGLSGSLIESSGCDCYQFLTVDPLAPLAPLNFGGFVNWLDDVMVWRKHKTTYANELLVRGTHYTLAHYATGTTITPLVDLSGYYVLAELPPNGETVGGRIVQPAPINFLFDGRSASVKIHGLIGGFGGHHMVFRNTTGIGSPGAVEISGGGAENCAGDVFRIETGTDYRLSNIYASGLGRGINLIRDPTGAQNITNVAEYLPSGVHSNLIQITQPAHGFDGTITVVVTGVLGVPQANARWWVVPIDANNYYLQRRFSNDEPSMWIVNPGDPAPVYTAGTGNGKTALPGAGGVVVANGLIRSCMGGGVVLNMPYVTLTGVKASQNGTDKTFYSKDIAYTGGLTNNGGLIRVVTLYPHRMETGDFVRLQSVKLAGVVQLSYVYFKITVIDSLTVDLVGSTWGGPYDAISAAAPAFLCRGGANLDIRSNASDVLTAGSIFGDINQVTDISVYGVSIDTTNYIDLQGSARGNGKASVRHWGNSSAQRIALATDSLYPGAATINVGYESGPIDARVMVQQTPAATAIGRTQFNALSSAGTLRSYAEMIGSSTTVTDAAEQGSLTFRLRSAGTLSDQIEITNYGPQQRAGMTAYRVLTDGATITPNLGTAQNNQVTLGGNRTMANPNGLLVGQTGTILIIQDGTGSRTLTFASSWRPVGGANFTLSTVAGAIDRLTYEVITTTYILYHIELDRR